MPYIPKARRIEIDAGYPVLTAGELNYVLTRTVHNYYLLNGKNYVSINDILGALEGAKLEFYRRVAAPYEDTKIKENGDVAI